MAKKVRVEAGQTLPDIAIQCCGSLTAWSTLAALNGLGLTADLTPGQMLLLPDETDKRTAAFFAAGGYKPAAGSILIPGSGISFMGIELDFIVQ